MKRLYFMAANVPSARRVVELLLLERIPEKQMHVIARHDVPLEDLPEASLYDQSDLSSALAKGVAIGGVAGALAGLAALAFPTGMVLGGGAVVLASTVAGVSVGAFSASLKGVDVPNTRLQDFEEDIQSGQILLMVDVPGDRVESTRDKVHTHAVNVRDKGQEAVMPRFP